MSAAMKTGIIALCGFALLVPLGLIAIGAGAQTVVDRICAAPSALLRPPSTSTSPARTQGEDPSTSVPLVPSSSSTCDGGDGLPDEGNGGIPAGYVFPSNVQQATAVAFALAQIGKPYVFGATGPNSYDCSGLVMKAWAAAGVSIPRTTQYQVDTGVAVTSLAAMEPGDLIFIPGSDGTMADPGHVGMYIGEVDGRQYLVQAPHTGAVVHTSLVSSWSSEVAAIRRPLYRQS